MEFQVTADVRRILAYTKVRNQVLACEACGLCHVSNGPIPGTLVASEILVIGEAPGRSEDDAGRPFVGKSGQELRTWLSAVGINPLDVNYINVVSCYPGRTPTTKEVETCRPNLTAQIAAVQPRWILVLGGVALTAMVPFDTRISDLHGYWWKMPVATDSDGTTISALVTATYHPSATLRNFHLLPQATSDVETFGVVVREECEMAGNSFCAKCKQEDVRVMYGEILGFCRVCASRMGVPK